MVVFISFQGWKKGIKAKATALRESNKLVSKNKKKLGEVTSLG
jgi:hypothetical protein